MLYRLFPFLFWVGELRDTAVVRADVLAGITVALVLIPQSMAYAQLAGLPPYYGLYAALLPPLVACLWGSSRQLSTGPVAMVSLLTGAALAPLAAQGIDIIPVAIMLALASGIIQLSMGLLKLGVIINFLSHPVLLGLTNAAALIIATSQLDKFLGVDVDKSGLHLVVVWRTISTALSQAYMPAIAMGLSALLIMIALRRWAPRLPAVLIAVAVATIASWLIDFDQHSATARLSDGESTGRVVGAVPDGLPNVAMPSFDWHILLSLWGPLLVIALVGFVEAVAIAKAMALSSRQRIDANQELIGQGLANIAGAFSQSYPCSGSYSRSAVNFSNGARTGFSSVVAAIMVAATLLFFTPLLWHIPEAVLAAVIFMAVASLIKIAPVRHAWRVSPSDALVAVVTFVVTLAAAPHLEIGILTGVALAMVLYLARTVRPHIAILARHPDGTLKDAQVNKLPTSPYILALRMDGRLYFANTSHFEDSISHALSDQPSLKVVILFANGINSIDASGEESLRQISERLHDQGIPLFICGAKKNLRDALYNGGWVDTYGSQRLIADEDQAINAAHEYLDLQHFEACPLRVYAGPL
ncbi:MAG: sulfate permease [Planctomycetota bacterium]|nr:MAG: sulfate permease [Planctomycetota bacterium]